MRYLLSRLNQTSREALFGSLVTLVIKTSSAGLIYLMFILISRAMSITEFGKFGFSFNIASFFAIVASCGVHVGINRWWPEYVAKDDGLLAVVAFFWGLRVTVAAAILASVFVALGAVVAGQVVRSSQMAVLVGSLLILPLALADYLANAMRAQGSTVWSQLPKDIFWRLVSCGMAAAAIFWGLTVSAEVALVALAGTLLILLVAQLQISLGYVRAVLRTQDVDRHIVEAAQRGWVTTAWPIWLVAVLSALVQNVDVLLVGTFVSMTESAQYFAAVRTVGLIGLMHVAATLMLGPVISRLLYSGQVDELQKILRIVMSAVLAATIGVTILIVVLGESLLGLFGEQFRSGYATLLILTVGFACNALCGSVGYVLMLSGNEKVFLKILAISFGCGLVVQLSSIAHFGSLGVAAGSTFSLVVSGLWARAVSIQRLGIDPTALSIIARRRKD